MIKQRNLALLPVGLSALLLSACGGSSSDSDPIDPDQVIAIAAADEQYSIGESIEFYLASSANATDISWSVSGAGVSAPAAPSAKMIAVTPSSQGTVRASVTYTNGAGDTVSGEQTISIDADEIDFTARLGHVVQMGNKVSLRAWSNSGASGSFSWRQVAGPNVSVETNDLAIFFDTPSNVNNDTLITFELTQAGSDDVDQVSVLVEAVDEIANDAYFDTRVAKVFPYRANSPYASVLQQCVYSNTLEDSCSLSSLPLLAQDTTTPSVDDVMNRVVVSHEWMGKRFEDFMRNYDTNGDFRNLLRATTAVVISYDVRPSFYWAVTGAIYLDANNFWLTPEERDTINEAPDFRAGFGNELQFEVPWRYVKNNDYVNTYVPSNLRITRPESYGVNRLISLMYHELAHANDFFPSTTWASASTNQSVLQAAIANTWSSTDLDVAIPLTSQEMLNLAQVSFQGETASETQKAYMPADVTVFFTSDHANSYYSYSTIREDFAMLFEELMMQYRYGILRDVAVTGTSDTNYMVDWGQRGRVNEPDVLPRAQFVLSRVIPEIDVDDAAASLITPIPMEPDVNWFDNINIGPNNGAAKTGNKQPFGHGPQNLPYYHKPIPVRK
ncbi:hypothetical protein [Thalassotalea agarivorans]|uniref:Ig-like domain-containing protein n=1 Tax=Thalassotalea agarivorans TaxID=349064 RepID=A0A1I0FIU6_THASX|nr:hypothetical protein [Thalassotalea agarivorans]SET58202.1 hypothetical protein SAMN05660429_02158 [Thalassotalea agarivorans]